MSTSYSITHSFIMIIFLWGKDTFRSRHRLRKMIEEFRLKRDPSGYNMSRLDALSEQPQKIVSELHTAPFLGEKRMVIVEHALESKHTILHEKIHTILTDDSNLPSTTICILFERTDAYKTKISKELLKKLSKTAYAQQFDILKGAELTQWTLAHAKECALSIEKNALEYITLHTKGDTWRIHSLIQQLSAYTNGAPCGIDTIRMFLPETADNNIFNLVDAIIARRSDRAYHMIREQYAEGQDAGYIFSMLVRQFRIMLELKDMMEHAPTTPPEVLAKTLGLHPFVVKKTLPALRLYPTEKLKDIYEKLLSIDIKTKTGKGNLPIMIDMLVGELCFS